MREQTSISATTDGYCYSDGPFCLRRRNRATKISIQFVIVKNRDGERASRRDNLLTCPARLSDSELHLMNWALLSELQFPNAIVSSRLDSRLGTIAAWAKGRGDTQITLLIKFRFPVHAHRPSHFGLNVKFCVSNRCALRWLPFSSHLK